MDAFVNEKDFELLADDRCTFQVLDRILRQECELIRTDHERLILCHSAQQYPVWIWTPDGISEAEKEAAWNLAGEFRFVEQGTEIIMGGILHGPRGKGGHEDGLPDGDDGL